MKCLRWKFLLLSVLAGSLVSVLVETAHAQNQPIQPIQPAPAQANLPGAPISVHGQGPYYQLNLPLSVQAGAHFSDLRDLQLRNQNGGVLPFAWLEEQITHELQETQAVPLFALPAQKNAEPANVSATLHLGPNGELQLRAPSAAHAPQATQGHEWIIDARSVRGQLIELRLALAPSAEGLFPFSLHTSSDLNLGQWRSAGNGQVARLKTNDGQVLEQLSVPLNNLQASFIRLRFQSTQAPRITEASLSSLANSQSLPTLQWSEALSPQRCTDQYCDYLLPRNASADSLRVQLAERNTLATLAISGLQSVNTSTYPARQRRNPLYKLTHLRPPRAPVSAAPAGQVSERDQWLSNAVVYRLPNPALATTQPESPELVSADINLDGGHYSHLRLRTQGPFARLGARPPVVQLGSYSKSVIFLAQGSAPYSLHWDAQAASAALKLSTLLPQAYSDRSLPTDRATVEALAALAAPVATSVAPAPNLKPASQPNKPAQPAWLWGVLVVALGVLGAMAWSLFKNGNKDAASDS